MSPKIFRESRFRFFFFSREETRMQVHVHGSNGEAKFWLEAEIDLPDNYGLRSGELSTVRDLLKNTRMKSKTNGLGTLEVEVTPSRSRLLAIAWVA